ncbi:HupE/UreJ family protein [Rhizobium ruizarguesonis]
MHGRPARFGLLHGLGFAGALSALALSAGDISLALLFFIVGVELGRLMFITAVIGLIAVVRLARYPARFGRHVFKTATYVIGGGGGLLVHGARGGVLSRCVGRGAVGYSNILSDRSDLYHHVLRSPAFRRCTRMDETGWQTELVS